MDSNVKKYCPNCSQHYSLQSGTQKSNLPLFLICGHSMCEKCILNIVKFAEPIDCKVCHREMEIKTSEMALLSQDQIKLYQLFPVNTCMVGELFVQHSKSPEKKAAETNYYVDIKAIIKSTDTTQGQCIECHKPTTKMCQQCDTIMCEVCYSKTHKNFIVFKNHVLKNIEPKVQPIHCKSHKEKFLEYYCNECKKSVCMDCLMVGGEKSCKNHDVVSMDEVNQKFADELIELTPKANEIYKRLTKTALDIGNLLCNIENETGPASELPHLISNVEQHFSKLQAVIQKHKNEVIHIITNLKEAEKESLVKCKTDVANAIKNSKILLNSLQMSSDPRKVKNVNLANLLEETKKALDYPWYLKRDETTKDPLKVAVNDDLCTLISDYIQLEGNAESVYKLCSMSELGEDIEIPPAPKDVVYPQELVKDVRKSDATEKPAPVQKAPSSKMLLNSAPRFRSKHHGSTTSINSVGSDSSQFSGISCTSSDIQNHRPLIQSVQPFAESYAPKQLHEGCQEVIYISHIVDPDTLFVQRASHQQLVKDLISELRSAPSAPKPNPAHVHEGKVYAVLNKVDNVWQRCRVINVDRSDASNPSVIVFSIDFGSTFKVTCDKLHVVRPGRVHTPPPLALHCRLHNCVPVSGTWNSDDSILIQKIINNRQAVMVVHDVESSPSGELRVTCDVLTYERGVDLARCLAFHQRAHIVNHRLPTSRIKCLEEKQRLYSAHDFKLRTEERVVITHIVSPDKFYVRKCHLQNVYEKMCDDLDVHYSTNDKSDIVYLPEIGMVCAVNIGNKDIESPGVWARGVVKELPGKQKVSVFLPDTGATTLVHWAALRYIDPKLNVLNALVTECHLAGVTPFNHKWSPRSVALMQQYRGRVLDLYVEDVRNKASIGVTLWDRTDEDNPLCVNQDMIKHKHAVSFGLFSFNRHAPAGEKYAFINKYPPGDKKRKPKNQITVLQRPPANDTVVKVKQSDLQAKDKGPLRLEIDILNYQSPSLIYLSFTHQQKAFNELFENIQMFYGKDKKGTSKSDWKVDDKCVSFCTESKTWRRAVITEIEGKDAKVFYTDFASTETVPLSGLKELTPDFSSMGNAAIKCHCSGVIPAVGDEWPSLTKEYLKELLDAYPRIFITKLGNFTNNSMPIEIWVYHTTQGGALEPNESEWRCLNKRIIEQGLGVPDKNQEPVGEDGTEKKDEDLLSFINSGRVSEWLNLEPVPLKPLTPNVDGNLGTSTPVEGEDITAEADSGDNTVYVTDWMPAEPLQNAEFVGIPTYLDDDCVVYLHDVNQRQTLDLITKALELRFKDPDPKAKFARWNVGEPCVAQFCVDKRYYRGRVTGVNEDDKTCAVQYIDFGNEETCSFEDMRKCIALYQIPTQAHRCNLARIKPIAGHWNRAVLDYIHKSIVEKQCHIQVTGPSVNDVTPINLKYDQLCINDHLVDFEVAEYEDGSKAVIRKFKPIEVDTSHNVTVESDSGPDYIIEDDDETPRPIDYSSDSMSVEGKDWNQVMEKERNDNGAGTVKFVTFPEQTLDEFQCEITVINSFETFELNIIHDDETQALYDNLSKELQQEALDLPKLDGVFENKACVALFHEDDQWYRASILEYSQKKQKVKVKYVDYGNVEIVSLDDVREVSHMHAQFPPSNITVKLFGVKVNSETDAKVMSEEYSNVFLDKGPFNAKVITYDPMPCVMLRNQKDELIYEDLINKGIFEKTGTGKA